MPIEHRNGLPGRARKSGRERVEKPRIAAIGGAGIRFEEISIGNEFRSLVLPGELRTFFQGDPPYEAIRINAPETAARMPGYAGHTSDPVWRLPHQPVHPADPRQFSVLTWAGKPNSRPAKRHASTAFIPTSTVEAMLPSLIGLAERRSDELKKRAAQNPDLTMGHRLLYAKGRFPALLQEIDNGVRDRVDRDTALQRKMTLLSMYLAPLPPQPFNRFVRGLVEEHGQDILIEPWDSEGAFVVRTTDTWVMDIGNGDPLKHDFLIDTLGIS